MNLSNDVIPYEIEEQGNEIDGWTEIDYERI